MGRERYRILFYPLPFPSQVLVQVRVRGEGVRPAHGQPQADGLAGDDGRVPVTRYQGVANVRDT